MPAFTLQPPLLISRLIVFDGTRSCVCVYYTHTRVVHVMKLLCKSVCRVFVASTMLLR